MKALSLLLALLLIIGCTQIPPQSMDDFTSMMPELDLSSPPQTPVNGELKSLTLNGLSIDYYSGIASYPDLILGADLLINVTNNDSVFKTVMIESLNNPPANCVMHFFPFHNNSITIKPNNQEMIHYFLSNDQTCDYDLSFRLSSGGESVITNFTIHSDNRIMEFEMPLSSIIYGELVSDDGTPIRDAEISVSSFTGRMNYQGEVIDGNYFVQVPGIDDLESVIGGQQLLFNSTDYFLTVIADGYDYYYETGLRPVSGELLVNDVTLTKNELSSNYSLSWDYSVSEKFGFFWLKTDNDWGVLAASQAKHPPELHEPTYFYLINMTTGEQLWSYPVGDECWGLDVSPDGSLVAAGCHDGNAYVVNAETGFLEWLIESPNYNRAVGFSNDGSYVVTGPAPSGAYALINAQTGIIQQSFSNDDWLRSASFANNQFYVSLSGGYTAGYSFNGDKLWSDYFGEFFLFFESDDEGNVYGSGKSRYLVSLSPQGVERWSFRVPDHTITAGDVSSDGSRLVVGTVGAYVYYVNAVNGEIIWRRRINAETVGHNAVSISSNGSFIAVGGGPENLLVVFDSKGNIIFEHEASLNDDPVLDDKWATIGAGASAGTQKGVMCALISSDGSEVIAAYGDNYIRKFTKP